MTDKKPIEDFLKEAIAKEPKEAFNKDLTEQILMQIEREESKRKPLLRSVATFAAALLICFALYLKFMSHDRTHSTGRVQKKLKENYVHPETIEASKWLSQTQEKSGEWNAEKWGGHKDFTVGLTGLSLMALQENINEQTKANLGKAKQYLINSQNDKGLFGPTCQASLYNHSIATLALLESYAIEKDIKTESAIDRGIDFIVTSQSDSGGWGYVQNLENTVNTSLTVWQINALVIAKALGWENLDTVIHNGQKWLQANIDSRGRSHYNPTNKFPNGHEALTAMANYCLRILKNPNLDTSVEAILKQTNTNRLNFYRDFFISSAAQLEEKDIGHLREQIAKAQIKGGRFKGSWYPEDRWGSAGGRIYATSMAVLSLQSKNRARKILNLISYN